MRSVLIACCMVYGSCAVAGDSPAAVKLVEVTRIWDQAPHNAFTDLVRFHDQWLCSFREGTGHAAGAGSIRVLISKDGKSWESAAVLSEPHVDLRDPKLSVTPDGRLMMVGGAAVPATRDPVTDHYSFVAFSKDGKEWSKPQRVLDSWQWLWRVTWHKGKAYGVAYQWDPKAARTERTYKAALFQSSDGVKFEQLASFDIPNATEATLAFAGDTLYCLQRRDGQPNSAMLGTSLPPYRDWTWKDLGHYFGGPNFIHLPDGSWWAAGRMIDAGKPQTVLCRLDVKKGELQPVLKLPSGGDTSYPGLVWHNGQLWISYYSSHEKKDGKDHSAIYLARVQVSAP